MLLLIWMVLIYDSAAIPITEYVDTAKCYYVIDEFAIGYTLSANVKLTIRLEPEIGAICEVWVRTNKTPYKRTQLVVIESPTFYAQIKGKANVLRASTRSPP